MRCTPGCAPGAGARAAGWSSIRPMRWSSANDHIVIARGRDYGDVSPVRGILRIAGEQTSEQAVDVIPVLATGLRGQEARMRPTGWILAALLAFARPRLGRGSGARSPRPPPRSRPAQSVTASEIMVATANPLRHRDRPRRAARRRLGGGRGGRGADDAEPGRAAKLGARRRRVPRLLGRGDRRADHLRRPRNRARRRDAGLLARSRRRTRRILGRGGGRPFGRGSRHLEGDGDAARTLWPPALGRPVPTRDRRGRGGLCHLATAGRRDRRGPGGPPRRLPDRAGLFLSPRRHAARRGGNPAQPRSRRDAAPDRRRGRRALLQRRARR